MNADQKKLHILILPSWYPSSSNDVIGVFFRDQALVLHFHGHKVGVIAPQLKSLRTLFNKSETNESQYFEIDEGVPTYRDQKYAFLPRVPYGNYWLFKRVARKLLESYIKEHGKPDIIHAHAAIFAGAAAVEIVNDFDIPVVVTEHSSVYAIGLYANWQLKLTEKAFNKAQSCIAVSPELGKFLGALIPSTQSNWKWIPNVVADRFKSPENYDPKQRPVRFLNLALMTENKGQFDLIKAFKLLVDSGVSAELWLAGDGPIRDALKQETQLLGIADKVSFLGLIQPDNVPKLLAQLDVMVVSSHYETFGVVAAEALMAGLPVIATRCGGPECIVMENDGLLVPSKNPEALSEAMQKMAQNLAQYDRKEIAIRAKARFSGSAVAVQLTQEYVRVINDHSDKPLKVGLK